MKSQTLTVFICLIMILVSTRVSGQVSISDTGAVDADPKSLLDLSSISKGVLLPRMTTLQMSSPIPAPDGLLIYNTDSSQFYYFNGIIENILILYHSSITIQAK